VNEKVDEKATSRIGEPIVGTSFNEKSGGLHGYQPNVVGIHPDGHPQYEDGRGLL